LWTSSALSSGDLVTTVPLPTWRARYHRPDALELASGVVTGLVADRRNPMEESAASPGPGTSARAVLEDLVRQALERPPCVIGFSGGRDSSALLALAMAVARRDGLEPPVPVTYRYNAEEAEAEESAWQELVVRHVGATDWEILHIGDRHDMVGDLARPFLTRHGLVYPPTLYNNTLPLALAAGGSHMSGEGGDEVFGARRATILRRLVDQPSYLLDKRHLRHAAMTLGPHGTRAAAWRYATKRMLSPCLGYLRPEAVGEVVGAVSREMAGEPFDFGDSLAWHLRRKAIAFHQEALVAFCEENDVYHLDPLLEPRFVAAYAASVRPLGPATRTAAMRALFGDLLPDAVLSRTSKALFNRGFLTDVAREFARAWDGRGVDTDLVDPEALRSTWLSPWPPSQSFWLLQAAWLRTNELALASTPAQTAAQP
jgi:hypothetical protein